MLSYIRLIVAVLIFAIVPASLAHEVRPAVADIQFFPAGEVRLSIEVNLEALIAGIDPKYSNTDDAPDAQRYNRLRALSAEQLAQEYTKFVSRYLQGIHLSVDGQDLVLENAGVDIPVPGDLRLSRISRVSFQSELIADGHAVQFAYAAEFGNIAVKFRKGEQQAVSVHWLTDGASSPDYTLDEEVLPRSRMQTAETYVELGFIHIVPKGIDHILFVLGLFLMSLRLGPLLAQVTAFTLAHSITLGLSIYGVISLSPLIVEPLIALSIAYVGIENVLRGHNSPSRIIVIFVFGLLHGLGFSTVLTEIGLPRSEFLTALLSFNIGVEFGQLTVIMLAMAVVYFSGLARHPRYREWVIIPGSILIALVGSYWFIERSIGLPW